MLDILQKQKDYDPTARNTAMPSQNPESQPGQIRRTKLECLQLKTLGLILRPIPPRFSKEDHLAVAGEQEFEIPVQSAVFFNLASEPIAQGSRNEHCGDSPRKILEPQVQPHS